jgi:flagella basal body P-ring formation protein FlgA
VVPHEVSPGQAFVPVPGVVPAGLAVADGPVVAIRSLKAGDPVRATDARPAPTRPRGAAVSLVVTRGAVQISAPAVLLEDAYLGRAVTVRNVATGALQRGTVVNASTVSLGTP